MWQTQIPFQKRDTNTFPVSFAQQRLWFFDQFEPGNSTYNVASAYRLIGPLDVTILEKSFNEVIQRHEILRTTFSSVGQQPVQVIAPSQSLRLKIVNLQKLPQLEREPEACRLATEEAQRPFDLAQSPLLRATLLRLDHEEHILLLTIHHIVFDGWSLGILLQELSLFYRAYASGKSPVLPELPIQYADFSVWQREWLQGEVLKTQLEYWKQQLDGAPPALELPTDRPRPAIQTFRGMSRSIILPKTLSEKLKQLSLQQEVTLFMTLLAAFKVLLYRYTVQDDIAVGIPIANRNRIEIEKLIGFFVNTLVLRTDLSDNPAFAQYLSQVRETALEAYNHQDLPFEKLVEELQPERDLSRTPLFQVLFNMRNIAGSGLDLPGLTIESLAPADVNAQFDLTLEAIERNKEIHLKLIYNIDLFEPTTITRMLDHLKTLLKDIVANPAQPLASLSLLTGAERQQLLLEWNDIRTDYPRDSTIQQLFEAQTASAPDATAVVYEDQYLTYNELNKRANQLAHYLQSLSVGPEVCVGLCLERSLEMMVGILGIVKAGGAYVPLDPGYPGGRLSFMLWDTKAPVLLTQQSLAARLPEYKGRVVNLDTDWVEIAQQPKTNPPVQTTAENLIYVIYTSGSIGRPKGVLIPHRALVNHSTAIAKQFELRSEDRVLQFASMSFDIAAEEIFPAWISGASVILRSNQEIQTFREFLQFLERQQLTVLNPPTAYWHEWVSALRQTEGKLPASVRLVITGGEKVEPEKYRSWRQMVEDDVRWINGYGPTETTITATCYEPAKVQDVEGRQAVPIGRPLTNIQTYLLDQQLNPVPIGVPGELYIGGQCLAHGYHNRPELTAELFIPHPFSEKPGERLYKTGDMARYLPDGTIEYLGRIDHQVKIRGYRIELGEIEARLCQHAAVREAVIIVREDIPDDKRLIGYVVLNPGATVPSSELRSFIKRSLPDYMIPSVIVSLEKLPLTPNGKIDRKALPVPDQTRPDLDDRFVAPRTEVEEIMMKIWTEILGLEQVGIHDNFFDLGGHSLLATQVILRISDTFDIRVPLRSLFEAPTIAGLAKQIEAISRILVQQASPDGKMDNREEIVL